MVYTLGESLLDIIISSLNDVTARPGGAMLNAAVSLGRLNVSTALITELGDDHTSSQIISFLECNNVSTNFIKVYRDNNSSLALAFLDSHKKPIYTFIKNYPEDRRLGKIPEFSNRDILLFGSLYSLDKNIRKSLLSIVNSAQKKGVIVIYDPNIRNAHHLKDDELRVSLNENIRIADIIKGSDEDFTNIFGSTKYEVQISELRKLNKKAPIIITLGADGVVADINGKLITLPAIETTVLSTIGAGDAFNAGIIYALGQQKIQKENLHNLHSDLLEKILISGIKLSSMVCSSLDNYISQEI